MAPKRKSTKNSTVVTVLDAITTSEALPSDLRSVLGVVLPGVLNTNKADRHPFEAEVVEQAGEALSVVQKAYEAAHIQALEKQKTIVSPDERTKREAAEKDAQDKLKQAEGQVAACDTSKKDADKIVADAESVVKASQKDESASEKQLQKTTKIKSGLDSALADAFVPLKEGSAFPTKSKKDSAVQLLLSLANEHQVGFTLYQAFALACKTEATSRSEFETTTLDMVKQKFDAALTDVSKQVEEETAVVEQKKAATTAAKEKLLAAQTMQKEASEKLAASRDALKEAKQNVSQAVSFRQNVWEEMKIACDAQDALAKQIKKFKEVVLPAFEELKEKAPVVEEPPAEEPAPQEPPAEEPPEKKQRTAEADTAPVEEPVAAADPYGASEQP
jgi:hypothetical protein